MQHLKCSFTPVLYEGCMVLTGSWRSIFVGFRHRVMTDLFDGWIYLRLFNDLLNSRECRTPLAVWIVCNKLEKVRKEVIVTNSGTPQVSVGRDWKETMSETIRNVTYTPQTWTIKLAAIIEICSYLEESCIVLQLFTVCGNILQIIKLYCITALYCMWYHIADHKVVLYYSSLLYVVPYCRS
jgi:hypothetical protein